MHIATISSKRQITIPKRMLDELDLKPKSKLLVTKHNGNLRLRPLRKSMVDELGGSLRKYVHPSLLGKSVEAIDREAKKLYVEYLSQKFKVNK